MPFFEENPVTPRQIAQRLGRAVAQNRAAGRSRRSPRQAHPIDDGERPDVRTTVDATIRPVGSGPYRRLAWAAGEPHRVRDDLWTLRGAGRRDRRRSLIYFAQHTDLHLCDAQSESRLVGAQGLAWIHPGADAAHRPQETMSTQVFDQMIRATNAIATSPHSGAAMAWCAQTGDHTDNRSTAAAHWWLDVLAGRRVTPDTGAKGRYEGVQRSGWPTVWNPDVAMGDRPQRNGFPHLPGVLDAAISPFATEGLCVPWLALLGNHDLLFTGMFGAGPGLGIDRVEQMVADTGRAPVRTRALIGALARVTLPGGAHRRWSSRPATGGGVMAVTPDPAARRPMSGDDWVAMIRSETSGAGPDGHGFALDDPAAATFWWSHPSGESVQVIGLDTNNHSHGEAGRLGPRQAAWLEAELTRHHSRHRDRDGRWVTAGGHDRLVVVLSHHNSVVIEPGADDDTDPGPSLDGQDLVGLLTRFPNVVLWCNGHSHQHRVIPHPDADTGGFWEVSNASVAAWPQQGRTHEIFDNADGTLSILSTTFDHAAPPAVAYPAPDGWTPAALASLSRELSVNDNRWLDPMGMLGNVGDRNVELVLAAPEWLATQRAV